MMHGSDAKLAKPAACKAVLISVTGCLQVAYRLRYDICELFLARVTVMND
jgi:hypothetical protein